MDPTKRKNTSPERSKPNKKEKEARDKKTKRHWKKQEASQRRTGYGVTSHDSMNEFYEHLS